MAKDKMRNKYQHELNKMVREINKNIKLDQLWKGRFEICQKDAKWERFEDNSGGILYVTYRMIDKKDGYYKDIFRDFAPWMSSCEGNLFKELNTFIIDDCKVWEEEPKPSVENAESYLESFADNDIMREDYNYFFSKEFLFNHWSKD